MAVVLRLVLFVALLSAFGFLFSFIPSNAFWKFDPEVLQQVVDEAVSMPGVTTKQRIDFVRAEVERRYPKLVSKTQGWMWNNAGGAMGSVLILHASITEYLIIFGTAVGTEGHSGRHVADDFFYILEGEQWAAHPWELEKRIYRPGDLNLMRRGDATQYVMPDKCWALEYARGWIPLMFPFGAADMITSTLDFGNFAQLTYYYGRAVVENLLQGKL